MPTPSPETPPRGYRALRRGRSSLAGHVYFVTVVVRERRPVFALPAAAAAACACLASPALLGEHGLLAWVLMPDHAHWLLRLGDSGRLSDGVGRLKSGIARTVNRAAGLDGALWQRGFHERAIRGEETLRAAARYLCANPVRAGLVERLEEYPYWGSVWEL